MSNKYSKQNSVLNSLSVGGGLLFYNYVVLENSDILISNSNVITDNYYQYVNILLRKRYCNVIELLRYLSSKSNLPNIL